MNEFDARARDWDSNPIHWERSEAIAKAILKQIPISPWMKALEYGAGTGILSFLLAENFAEITLMDNSREMVQVMHEKVANTQLNHLKPQVFDLEQSDYTTQTFDCIFTQMVLHHVSEPTLLLTKFYRMLNPGGYLAIADLYPEDGSFHGNDFNGHKGFDPSALQTQLEETGFINVLTQPCYAIQKTIDDTVREFPIFLMVGSK
jgi:2-polyprenyl-3-methyl-5-hydroxy-6-metoxy-1,4-benzoquinol methylase